MKVIAQSGACSRCFHDLWSVNVLLAFSFAALSGNKVLSCWPLHSCTDGAWRLHALHKGSPVMAAQRIGRAQSFIHSFSHCLIHSVFSPHQEKEELEPAVFRSQANYSDINTLPQHSAHSPKSFITGGIEAFKSQISIFMSRPRIQAH